MHHLVYSKQINPYGDVELICKSFPSRKDLLIWALGARIRLYKKRTIIIGPDGEERGCPDIHAELEAMEANNEKQKEKSGRPAKKDS